MMESVEGLEMLKCQAKFAIRFDHYCCVKGTWHPLFRHRAATFLNLQDTSLSYLAIRTLLLCRTYSGHALFDLQRISSIAETNVM